MKINNFYDNWENIYDMYATKVHHLVLKQIVAQR